MVTEIDLIILRIKHIFGEYRNKDITLTDLILYLNNCLEYDILRYGNKEKDHISIESRYNSFKEITGKEFKDLGFDNNLLILNSLGETKQRCWENYHRVLRNKRAKTQIKYRKEYYNQYYKLNPGKAKELQQKNREKLYNIIEDFSGIEWLAKLSATKGRCPNCKHFVGMHNLTIDHVYPTSIANKNFKRTGIKRVYTINDVQPLCFGCNLNKGNRTFDN